MTSNPLRPLITSKPRLKLLLRLFLKSKPKRLYLQGLSNEPNRLEEAGLLSAEEQGRLKVYSINTAHPLSTDLPSILRKGISIDHLVGRVVSRIGHKLEQVWITSALAMGINSDEIEVTLVGEGLDMDYLGELMNEVESLIEKTIAWQVRISGVKTGPHTTLLVW